MIGHSSMKMERQLQHGAVLAATLAASVWLSAVACAQGVYPSDSSVQSVPLGSTPSPSTDTSSPTTKSLGTITLAPGENIDHPGISDDEVDSGDLNVNHVAYDEAAMNAYKSHDYVEARSLWEKAAKAGDPTAMFQLAGMIERGEGGDRDLDQALGWYSAATQKGVKGAAEKMTALSGRMRKEAAATEAANQAAEKARQAAAKKQADKDAAARAARDRQAAEKAKADAAAQARVDQAAAEKAKADAAAQARIDQEAAAKAAADAAERPAPTPPPKVTAGPDQGNAAPVTSYSQSHKQAGANKQPEGKQSANEPAPPDKTQQMASANDAKVSAEDAFKRGLNAAAGHGVAKSDAEAVKWFRIAADQGYAPAENNLGFMYAEGRGMKKDPVQAVIWFKKAADQNYAPAQTSLGMLYATGSGVPKDDTEALALYSSAASQNYAQGTANLAQMYAEGRGIEKDERTAQFLLSSVKEKPRQSPTIYVDSGS